jgi:ubiquinone/menaquinone biosynthesis C-methylase UbiE
MSENKKNTIPDYSPFADIYAHSRPRYPSELFNYLVSLVDRHHLAWDCATGNGQTALELARHFDRIIATDISAEQINNAMQHPNIEYRVVKSEQSGLEDRSIDLVTIASAIHWFNLDDFYQELQRVVYPGGVVAAFTYHVGYVKPPFDRVFNRFYLEVLSPYFAPGASLVDNRYETITLPGKSLDSPDFQVSADWNFNQMLAFIRSWSGTQQYIRERGEDPVDLIREELSQIWGTPQSIHTLRWPLYLRIARLNS